MSSSLMKSTVGLAGELAKVRTLTKRPHSERQWRMAKLSERIHAVCEQISLQSRKDALGQQCKEERRDCM